MPRPLRHIARVAANRRRRRRPSPWALLAVVLAALVCLGSPCDYGEEYQHPGVGSFDDGTLVIDTGSRPERFSEDGGYTWQPLYTIKEGVRWWTLDIDERWRDTVQWGERGVETPSGRYFIEVKEIRGDYPLLHSIIIRIEGNGSKVVYSPPHLQTSADRRFRARQHAFYDASPSMVAHNLIYHAPSGNVVAVLGLEGAVIGDAEDNWRPLLAAIGEQAVDVSIRTRVAFSLDKVWPAAIVVAIAATAAALAFKFLTEVRSRRAANSSVSGLILVGFLGPLVLTLLIGFYWVLSLGWGDVFEYESGNVLTFQLYFFNAIVSTLGAVAVWRRDRPWFEATSLLASAAVPLIVVIALIGIFDNWGFSLRYFLICTSSIIASVGGIVIWIKVRALVGASVLVIACIAAVLMLLTAHADYSGLEELIFMALSPFSLIAFISFASYFVRQLHVVFAALIGMAALIALSFAIDAALWFSIWTAKVFSIAMVAAVTFGLIWYLRKSQRLSQQPQ